MNWNAVIAGIVQEPLLSTLAIVLAIVIVFCISLSLRINRLTQGRDGKTLEGTIKALGGRVGALESYAQKNQSRINHMETRLARAVQGVAAIRFDPFGAPGGRQSFATAFINEHGDGVIVSGIHSRDQVRVYAKAIKNFTSEHELSEEETQAIKRAKEKLV